jgi:hypothetical protein
MLNTITPTVFYRTLNVEGLEIFYREASQKTSSAAGPGRHGAPEDVAPEDHCVDPHRGSALRCRRPRPAPRHDRWPGFEGSACFEKFRGRWNQNGTTGAPAVAGISVSCWWIWYAR